MATDTPNKSGNDDQFPGYPHYPSDQDITNQASAMSFDEESLKQRPADDIGMPDTGRPVTQAGNAVPIDTDNAERNKPAEDDDAGDATVTDEERMLLDRAERGVDSSDDETAPVRAHLDETDEDGDPLNEAAGREGYLGDDLVVPGSELDDANENIGEEDEENNYYSIGSDDNDNLEDNGSN